MNAFYDAIETRDPEQREREQLARLAQQIAHARSHAPAYARLLADVDPREVTSREALARLPVTRKSDLARLQKDAPPLGGFAAGDWSTLLRVFASPGAIHEPEGRQADYWRIARALFCLRDVMLPESQTRERTGDPR